jgi:8-oxo-dGTP diphosphatase
LIHDWAPNDAEGDKVLYVFDCGKLGEAERSIRLDRVEVDKVEWVRIDDLVDYVIPRLERRLVNAYRAYTTDTILYLEHGQPRT